MSPSDPSSTSSSSAPATADSAAPDAAAETEVGPERPPGPRCPAPGAWTQRSTWSERAREAPLVGSGAGQPGCPGPWPRLAMVVIGLAVVVVVRARPGGEPDGQRGAAGVAGHWCALARPTPVEATASPSTRAAGLVVQVAGAVADPGVYHLPSGSRVARPGPRQAGGLAADADGDRVNQAAALVDGTLIYVPRLGQTDLPDPVDGGGTDRRRGSSADGPGQQDRGSARCSDRPEHGHRPTSSTPCPASARPPPPPSSPTGASTVRSTRSTTWPRWPASARPSWPRSGPTSACDRELAAAAGSVGARRRRALSDRQVVVLAAIVALAAWWSPDVSPWLVGAGLVVAGISPTTDPGDGGRRPAGGLSGCPSLAGRSPGGSRALRGHGHPGRRSPGGRRRGGGRGPGRGPPLRGLGPRPDRPPSWPTARPASGSGVQGRVAPRPPGDDLDARRHVVGVVDARPGRAAVAGDGPVVAGVNALRRRAAGRGAVP